MVCDQKTLFYLICCFLTNGKASWENHVAASTNDLKRLFEMEVGMIANLQHWSYLAREGKIKEPMSDLSEDMNLIDNAFQRIDIASDWYMEDALTYVMHPVNAYNLLKRTTTFWPRIFENTKSMSLEEEVESTLSNFPKLEDFQYGACIGLVNLELHYGSNGNSIMELAQGIVTDPFSKSTYRAKHTLTSEDCFHISQAAKQGKLYTG